MKKSDEFYVNAANSVDNEGYIKIDRLHEIYSNKSTSYISVGLNNLKKRGLAELVAPNKWRLLVISQSATVLAMQTEETVRKQQKTANNFQVLTLTPAEKKLFFLLTDLQIKCTNKNGETRFNEESVQKILQIQKFPAQEWETLKEKLISLHIIEPKGLGKRGKIFFLDENLLLEYLTNENLVKETKWQEDLVKQKLDVIVADFKTRSLAVRLQENLIAEKQVELETARLRMKSLEDEIKIMEKSLKSNFPDKDQILELNDFIASIENLGQEILLSFLKKIFD